MIFNFAKILFLCKHKQIYWINNNKNNKNGIQPTFSLLVPTNRELVETIYYVLNDSSKMDSMLSLGDYDYTLHSLELLLHKKCKGCHTLLIKLYYFNWIEIVVVIKKINLYRIRRCLVPPKNDRHLPKFVRGD